MTICGKLSCIHMTEASLV